MTSHHNSIDTLKQRYRGQRITFVSGLFNILHAGHLRLLRFAKECGDILVVGVLNDSHSPAINHVPEEQRLRFVESIDWIDEAVLLQGQVEDYIHQLQPAIIVKGKEHERQHNPEAAVIADYGGKLLFSAGDSRFTFGEIIRLKSDVEPSSIVSPTEFLFRHNTTLQNLSQILTTFKQISVCVIGDTIVDEYIRCEPLGMSQEDPTLVVAPIDTDRFVGGAAIVASHIKALGASHVNYFSVLGKDSIADFVYQELEKNTVDLELFVDDSRPTTLKQRFRARNKTLLRVNQLRQHQISLELQENIYQKIIKKIDTSDLLVFSDFNYGVLPQQLVERIASYAQSQGVICVADSQSSSQLGDISRFTGMALISPTEHEARLALQNSEDGLVVLAEKLRNKAGAKHVLVTLAEDGVLIHADAEGDRSFVTDRLPAFNQLPQDNAGAGDCMMAVAAMSLVAGASIWEASYLGSLAAAIQVGRVGNTPLSNELLQQELESIV
ncbi:MAG: adenylyltransferase/cytidyltransferase family protein [Spongiibacteraceae bacterium]|nr:adenylyltransferase/cytidyltransferase family protein [Spongiibacteraceae bacterium]